MTRASQLPAFDAGQKIPVLFTRPADFENTLDAAPGRGSLIRQALHDVFAVVVRSALSEYVMPAILPAPPSGKLTVLAVGKGAAEMMRVAQCRKSEGQRIQGLVVTRYGHLPDGGAVWPDVEVIEAGHPYPDVNSVRAAERALQIAQSLDVQDHLLVLLSGGGSALLAAPAQGIDLGEKQALTRTLLRSGAAIEEINCVRKHLSRIKAGRLAVAAAPAQVTTWIISDVPGDDPSLVSSGPTVADRSRLKTARDILARYGIKPSSAVAAALKDPQNETPDANAVTRTGSEVAILACAADALTAASAYLEQMGYSVRNLGDRIEGEARHVAVSHASLARRHTLRGTPVAIISGGETTVTVANERGRGGRNLEYLLALAIELDGAPGINALACDTDGIDGTEDAAGAIITPDTLERARATGMDPAQYLSENNAYLFFEAIGDLVKTGPTLTNVNDFRVILIEGEEQFS